MERAHPATLLIAGDVRPYSFDSVVMCASQACAALLKPLGLNVPLAAVYGYSITRRESLNAPRSPLMDERYKVAIFPAGQPGARGRQRRVGRLAGAHAGSLPQDALPNAARLIPRRYAVLRYP